MGKIKDIVTSYPALSEFGLLAKTIQPIMVDPKVSRTEKRKTLCNLVDQLSKKTLNNGIVAEQIMKIINMGRDVCMEYQDTNAQVQGILSWCPLMKQHREKLVKEVEKHRKQFGMKI